MKLKNYLNCWS